MACVVTGCTNRNGSKHRSAGITFHRFPFRDPTRIQQWISNIDREDWFPTKFSRLCSVHFTSDFFDRTGETARLRDNAVPTIFPCAKKVLKGRGKDPEPDVKVSHHLKSWKFKLATSKPKKSSKAPCRIKGNIPPKASSKVEKTITKFQSKATIKVKKELDVSHPATTLKLDDSPPATTLKKSYKRKYSDSEKESEDYGSDLETEESEFSISRPMYKLSPKNLDIRRVKYPKSKKHKSASKALAVSPLDSSDDDYSDSNDEASQETDEEEAEDEEEESYPIVSIQDIKKKLAASLEDIKRKLNANITTTVNKNHKDDLNIKVEKDAIMKVEKDREKAEVSPVKRLSHQNKNHKDDLNVKVENIKEETEVLPAKRLPRQDKVTQLPNNCILYEFATPRRQVVLKLNPKVEPSELQSRTLEALLTSLGEKRILTSDGQELLNAFGVLPKGLNRIDAKSKYSGVSIQNYTEEIKKFATMLLLCSPEAYDLACKIFNLPDKSALQGRLQVNDYWPGFTKEALTLLKNKESKTPADTVCSIMLDSVCVKRQWDFDDTSGRWIGHVDFGGGQEPSSTDENLSATEVLIFTVVGLGNEWKMPFGYFLNKGISGELLKNLVQEAVLALEECDLDVRAIVCNGSASCIKMGKLFGCNIRAKSFTEIITSFPHPLNEKLRIYLVFGIRHALKLLINLLKDKGSLRSSTYGIADWKFVKQMFGDLKSKKQKSVNLKHPSHIKFYHLQRAVRLCNSNFNCSLSNALELADEFKLKEYFGCRATSSFAADIHRAFDLLNSRNPVSSEDKPPIRLSTMQEQVESMMDVAERIIGLELLSGERVIKEGRWMSVLLFAFTLKSVAHLATELMNDKALQYFCTYRVNLDHLEMVLSNLQRHGGWNGMPSPSEFRNAYKHFFERSSEKIFYNYDFEGEDFTVGQGEIYTCRGYSPLNSFDISEDIVSFHYLLDLRTDVMNRARRVIREVSQRLSCPECMGIMLDDDYSKELKTKKVIINLIQPSRFVMEILKTSERVLNAKLIESNVIENERIVSDVYSEYLALDGKLNLPNTAVSHMNEEPLHIMCLIKVVIRCYITLRLYKRRKFKKQYKLLQYS